jgi:hypothetical protein
LELEEKRTPNQAKLVNKAREVKEEPWLVHILEELADK